MLLLSALATGCLSSVAPALSGSKPPAPLAPPGPGAAGCVESGELKAFVLALESERRTARARALAQLGVVESARPSRFAAAPTEPSTGVNDSDGPRLAVVGRLATNTPPLVPLAQREQLLQLIDERPRAHPIPLRVCGVNACAPSVWPSLPPLRAVAVELAAGEQLGPPLQLSYDYWWAQVSYDRTRRCPERSGAALSTEGASTQ